MKFICTLALQIGEHQHKTDKQQGNIDKTIRKQLQNGTTGQGQGIRHDTHLNVLTCEYVNV